MKDVGEVVACVWDYGTFLSLAERLAKTMAKVYVYTPYEHEYLDILDCEQATGLHNVVRLDDPLMPEFLKEIDLYVFPDRGYGGVQRHLREDMHKAVWGSMGACELEEYRTLFLNTLKELDLPVATYVRCNGLTKLSEHLKEVENKWVKIDRYRANMETWKHIDYVHSQRKLESLAAKFGPLADEVVFTVWDEIDPAQEIGYDGFCIDGEFPPRSFQGYEKKNELYLGSLLKDSEIPEEVREVNKRFASTLEQYGYRNFWATELRRSEEDGKARFIDPTARMPGQTGEHLLESCTNLPLVMWQGANGVLVPPEFKNTHAAEATLHYTAGGCDDWKTLAVPKTVAPYVMLYHFCARDGVYHFMPSKTDELGVVIGLGDSVEDAHSHLKENLEKLKDEPVCAETDGFLELLGEIKQAEEAGMKFSEEPLPEPVIEQEKDGALEVALVPARKSPRVSLK